MVAAAESEAHLRAELDDLRRGLLSALLLVVPVFSWAWFLAVLFIRREVAPENIPPSVLGLAMYLVYRLRNKNHDLASWVFLLDAILVESLVVALYPSLPVSSYGVVAIILANALLGGHQALLVAVATWVAVAATRHLISGAWQWYILDTLFPYLLTCAAVWLAAWPLRTLVSWALSGWQRANKALLETRERRGELYRALRALEEATYRIERMNGELVVARRQAEEARALKARFAAAVSHELRGPLNLILGFSQVIARSPERYGTPLPAAYQADVDAIYRNSQHMLALVDDILDLSRIEAERMPLVKDRLDLEEDVVKKVIPIVAPLAARKGLRVRLELSGQLPWVLADPVRLRQALLNLLANAVRFTDKGEITVRTIRQDDGLVVSVQDTGPGIELEEMRQLFLEFSQVAATETREAAGTGLGLSISKHLIELHGGRIWVDSKPGVGTCFSFSLPLPGADEATAGFAPSEPVRYQYGTESCLIVHDDPGIVRLLARHIEDYRIVGLPDEQEVAALADYIHPRAIITTPLKEEAVRQALSTAALDVPTITCSMPRIAAWTENRGVLGYLIKPISADMVMAVMRRVERNGVTTILLVDDDPDAVRLLERMLTAISRPYNILRAYNGAKALEIMQQTVPDVVFMDLLMPELDGQQAIARMREDERTRGVPVVIVSALDWLEDEAALETPIGVRCTRPVEIARAAKCLKALMDAITPTYLPDQKSPGPL